MADPRIEKWRRWFEQGITDDIYTMHLERFAWQRMEEIVSDNPALKRHRVLFGRLGYRT